MKTKRYVKSWLNAYGEVLPDHLKFSAILIQKLIESGPISLTEIEIISDIKIRRLKNFLKKRPRTEFNEDHKIIAHGPFSIQATAETMVVDGVEFKAASAFDALMLVFYISRELIWKSKCAVSGAEIEVKILPEGIETLQEGIYISFVHPDELEGDLIDSIGQWSVALLGDDAAEKYLTLHPKQIAIPLTQAYQFARDAFEGWLQIE